MLICTFVCTRVYVRELIALLFFHPILLNVYVLCVQINFKRSFCVNKLPLCLCVDRFPVSRSVSTLQDIPEVLDELERAPESPG